MRIEILHVEDCPNAAEAGERTRAALAAVGAKGREIAYRLITEPAQLEGLDFAGSPTILLDGTDLFPSDGATRDLACRVYVSHGRMAKLPADDEIAAALRSRGVGDAQG